MDLFNLGNLTACCTCSRKTDVKANGDDGKGFAQRTSDDNNMRGRLDKPQLGGVGIVFQGTDDGGLKVRLAGLPSASISPPAHLSACPRCRRSLACKAFMA